MTVDHDRLEDAVAAHVLGACEPEEADRVRAHIVACPGCRALARRLAPAVGALPLAADEVRPPDHLRARILAAAASTPRRTSEETAPPARVVSLLRAAGGRPPRRGWRRARLPGYRAAIAVLAVALVAVVVWNVTLNGRAGQAPPRYTLVGTGTMAGASGTFTEVRQQEAAVLALNGMPPPPAGRVYELWLIDSSNRAIPAGVFTPNADGAATVGVSHPLAEVRTVAVTQEEGPLGAKAPTQKPELAVQIGG
jgi:anti-sigma-K factor RskA